MATEKSNCETRGSPQMPKITVEIDSTSIDELKEKLKELNGLLKSANDLLNSLTDRGCSKE